MKSRFLILLLAIFTTAIIGLMAVQFVQGRRSAEISDGLFNSSIVKAMDNVLQQLTLIHPEEFVNERDRYIIAKYRRVDELNNKMIMLLSDRQDFFFDIQRVKINVSLRDSAEARNPKQLHPSEQNLLTKYNTLLTVRNRLVAELENESNYSKIKRLQGDDFLDSGNFNYERLESIICDELIVNGIDDRPMIGVCNVTTDHFLHTSDNANKNELRNTPYKYSFRLSSLPASNEYCIMLVFPSKYRFLRSTNIVFIAINTLLLIIIFILFYIAVRIIFNMRKLDEMKTTFINNMTHEIKTPIATIGLACEMLNDPSVEQDENTRHNFINAISEENRRMRIPVETILQNAKMASGKMSLTLKETDLNEIAKEAKRSFSLALKQRDGLMELELDENMPNVYADQMHISNVIHNLVDNAIKYSEGKPYIKITTLSQGDTAVVKITDHGIGIAKEDQKHVFEKFYRISTGDVHNVKGFGIGLNYVANVIALHKGKIEVESELGQGSTFTITLPSDKGSEKC